MVSNMTLTVLGFEILSWLSACEKKVHNSLPLMSKEAKSEKTGMLQCCLTCSHLIHLKMNLNAPLEEHSVGRLPLSCEGHATDLSAQLGL